MATQYFTGGNTIAAAGWDGSGIQDGDGFIVRDSNTNITAGLDTTGSTTNGVEWFIVLPSFTADIGTVSSNLQVEFNSGWSGQAQQLGYYGGAGNFYLDCASTCASAVVHSGGKLFHNDGTITTLIVNSGEVQIGSTAVVTNLIINGGSVRAEDGTDFTTVKVTGGFLYSNRGLGTVDQIGGTIEHEDESGSSTTMNVYGGVFYQIRGSVTNANVFGGTWNEARADYASTVTNFNRYARGKVIENPQVVTHTNDTAIGAPIIDGTGFGEGPSFA